MCSFIYIKFGKIKEAFIYFANINAVTLSNFGVSFEKSLSSELKKNVTLYHVDLRFRTFRILNEEFNFSQI